MVVAAELTSALQRKSPPSHADGGPLVSVGANPAPRVRPGAERPDLEATPRPMTHDLLKNVIADLKADIQKIVVSDLRENTFYALIYLMVNGEPVAIDARPSDAIALALRAQAPIFVEDRVIDHAKTVDFVPDKENSERLQKWLESLDPETMGRYKM